MKFKTTFLDIFEAESEEEAYNKLLDYLADCVKNRDVTAFYFYEV